MAGLIPFGEAQDLTKRHLTEETCRRAGYTVSRMGGELVQVANYRDDTGAIVAQKVRGRDKEFRFLGDTKSAGLFMQHLWRDGGKRIIITEGEVDALTVFQEMGYKWPVVSVPNGAQGAKKSLGKHLEWLLKFEHVDLCFDQDDPGREATEACLELFPPGHARIIRLPLKDANEMLQEGRRKELIDALWSPVEFRPDGIVTVADIFDEAMEEPEGGLPWFLDTLTAKTFGRRYGEAVALGAGTGIGKTDFITQQITFDIDVLKKKVAVFAFEQVPKETLWRIAGKAAGKTFHIPDGSWSKEEKVAALTKLRDDDRLYFYNHFGACDWDIVSSRIRFLAHTEGVRIFYIDHLTALAGHGDEERGSLEKIMAELGALVKELDIWVLFVSHLTTPEGKPHEEGGRVTIKQFKGSRAIGYWSHFMFGMERDTQAEDEEERQTTTFRVLKDRYTGRANGLTIPLEYDTETGRLSEVEARAFPPTETDEEKKDF
ncbi:MULTISPECIES: DnaB-like helicase C-terminal domain-containing protein [unclassified Xanthobacter]|uniref:DnaB-like helicase C-terminal domain-containing protein n=1 Tax=unclassified Xanthobacter TaxID=2623496 RepID=UPI001F3B1ACA